MQRCHTAKGEQNGQQIHVIVIACPFLPSFFGVRARTHTEQYLQVRIFKCGRNVKKLSKLFNWYQASSHSRFISCHWNQKDHPDCSVSIFIHYFILVLCLYPKLRINILCLWNCGLGVAGKECAVPTWQEDTGIDPCHERHQHSILLRILGRKEEELGSG